MAPSKKLLLDPQNRTPLLQDENTRRTARKAANADETLSPDDGSRTDCGGIFFVGTATTILEWHNFRILTDPNFLHAGDHVHLGPGVSATRQTNPAVDLEDLDAIDCILLSHYHEDHFDKLVQDSITRDFPIITTSHAKECLTSASHVQTPFSRVTSLEPFEEMILHSIPENSNHMEQAVSAIKVTGMPGKHVPPGPLSWANDLLSAVPPTNGWLLELGFVKDLQQFTEGEGCDLSSVGYRIYISGDTLFCDELKDIPERLGGKKVDLMLIHLGGTTIPGPSAPLVMVTMDAKQGIQLMRLIRPETTIPIHYDDYDVFLSPLSDFQHEVRDTEFKNQVVYLDRGERFEFKVQQT